MPGLLSECKEVFGTDDLYKVLNIKKDAKQSESKFCLERFAWNIACMNYFLCRSTFLK